MSNGERLMSIMKRLFLISMILSSGVLNASPPLIPIVFNNQQQTAIITIKANVLYKEAFRRLGYQYISQVYPAKRSIYLVEQAKIDGLVHRVQLFELQHPMLIRVKEPIVSMNIAAYGMNPKLKINHWQDLQHRSYHINYWRNIEFIQQKLQAILPKSSLEAVNSSESGLRKLMIGRADIYMGVASVVDILRQQTEFKSIKKLGVIQEVPLYPYLNQRHQELAPKLAKMLRQLKKEAQ